MALSKPRFGSYIYCRNSKHVLIVQESTKHLVIAVDQDGQTCSFLGSQQGLIWRKVKISEFPKNYKMREWPVLQADLYE
jgi:hypothetical protein